MSAYLKKLSLLWMTLALVGAVLPTHAQTFSSGSSGLDGDFHPTANVTLQIPASGIFNFKTITIPSGVTVTFTRNAQNTPVTMLATGDVLINGTIDISGGNGSDELTGGNTGTGMIRSTPGKGGPGGFDGGGGGAGQSYLAAPSGVAGDGPGGGGGGLGDLNNGISGIGGGGGFATPGADGNDSRGGNGKGGPSYGSPTLLQLIGGSGGGGTGTRFSTTFGYSGGGGGGAIVIASSTTISSSFYATFNAQGGAGQGNNGAGGAVRLIANTLSGTFYVGLYSAYLTGGSGYARFEAFNFVNFNPNIQHSLGTVTVALPSSVTLPNPPTLQIVSVGGIAAPSVPKGDFNAQPDITLDTNAPNPARVNLAAANMPVNTVVNVQMSPEQGDKVNVSSSPLVGTTTASSATADVPLPASLLSVLTASVTIDLSSVQTASTGSGGGHKLFAKTPPLMLEGELVTRMEVASAFGGGSDVIYVTKSGKRFSRSQLLGPTPKQVVRN